jgi:hypothetical protein
MRTHVHVSVLQEKRHVQARQKIGVVKQHKIAVVVRKVDVVQLLKKQRRTAH